MDMYKEKLKKRQQWAGSRCIFVSVCLTAVSRYSQSTTLSLPDYAKGFANGLATAFALLIVAWGVFAAIRIQRALKDDTLLRKMYIAENDERRIFIQNKVGGTGLRLAVFLLSFAAIVACYFNMVIAYTLIGAALGISLLMLGFKLYYRNKY